MKRMGSPLVSLVTFLLNFSWNLSDEEALFNLLQHQVPPTELRSPSVVVMERDVSHVWNLTVPLSQWEFPESYNNNDRARKTKSIVTTDERQIRFYLYADKVRKKFGHQIRLSDPTSIERGGMHRHAQLKILIHGFQQSYITEFPQHMKDAYLSSSEEDYNVICVDWGPLARGSGPLSSILYPLVVENVPKVGAKVADLISFLRSHGFILNFESVHLIGFSLGAHAAGIAGSLVQKKLYKKIGRITGLDPAGPKYSTTQPFTRRLDPTDATFVDVVHTNSLKFGYAGQLGHVDFYPNGGKAQPNCESRQGTNNRKSSYSIQHIFAASCSHSRAPTYFTKSISSKEMACRCSSWKEFQKSCRFNCRDPVIFGEHVPHKARGKYFLDVDI